MASPDLPQLPAIGGCLQCMNLTLLTEERPVCFICGRPPDFTLPFPDSGGATVVAQSGLADSAAPPAANYTIPVTCPDCGTALEVDLTDEGISVAPTPPLEPVEDAAGGRDTSPPAAPSPEDTASSRESRVHDEGASQGDDSRDMASPVPEAPAESQPNVVSLPPTQSADDAAGGAPLEPAASLPEQQVPHRHRCLDHGEYECNRWHQGDYTPYVSSEDCPECHRD